MKWIRWTRVVSLTVLTSLLSSAWAASEAIPGLLGVEVARTPGGFLGVAIEDRTIVVRFYDRDKVEITADMPRGSVRWRELGKVHQVEQNFLVLRVRNGVMYSPARVYPPFNFKAYVNLLNAEGEVEETYAVNFLDLKRS